MALNVDYKITGPGWAVCTVSHYATTCEISANQVQCNSDSLPELWWFTEPGHPAYPSASRGQMMRNDATGAVCLLRDGYFAGAEAPFAAWMDWLKKYDQATIDRVVGHPFPTT